jgi:hypothetical protein
MLLGMEGAIVTLIQRYSYDDIMSIENIWKLSNRVDPYRIFGHTGAVVWQCECTKNVAIGEFSSRCNPYIPISQRAMYMELVRVYRKVDIDKAIKALYGVIR